MPPTPIAVLEIDDNTPRDLEPFTNGVSMWSFRSDFNLATRTAAETFRAIHEAIDHSRFRGYPKNVASATVKLFDAFVTPDEVTWLTGAELATASDLLPKGPDSVCKTLRMVFEIVEVAARHFGADRVRLVFAFA